MSFKRLRAGYLQALRGRPGICQGVANLPLKHRLWQIAEIPDEPAVVELFPAALSRSNKHALFSGSVEPDWQTSLREGGEAPHS